MADTKLSALTELATTPADDDEIYIRDISEPAADESKRITIANLLAGGVSDPHGAAQHTDVTRYLWLPANEGFIQDGTSTGDTYWAAVKALTNSNLNVKFTMKVPDDFVSFSSMKAMWKCGGAGGNAYWNINVEYAAAGENKNTHSDTPALGTTANGGGGILNVQEPANPLSLSNLAIGDSIGIQFYRNGAHANDTLPSDMIFHGLLFTYVAHQ